MTTTTFFARLAIFGALLTAASYRVAIQSISDMQTTHEESAEGDLKGSFFPDVKPQYLREATAEAGRYHKCIFLCLPGWPWTTKKKCMESSFFEKTDYQSRGAQVISAIRDEIMTAALAAPGGSSIKSEEEVAAMAAVAAGRAQNAAYASGQGNVNDLLYSNENALTKLKPKMVGYSSPSRFIKGEIDTTVQDSHIHISRADASVVVVTRRVLCNKGGKEPPCRRLCIVTAVPDGEDWRGVQSAYLMEKSQKGPKNLTTVALFDSDGKSKKKHTPPFDACFGISQADEPYPYNYKEEMQAPPVDAKPSQEVIMATPAEEQRVIKADTKPSQDVTMATPAAEEQKGVLKTHEKELVSS